MNLKGLAKKTMWIVAAVVVVVVIAVVVYMTMK